MAGKELQTVATFETALGSVTISFDDIKRYLCRGNKEMTDQECKLFLELCKYQKLNPYTNECYPIKFGDDFQIVVGYEAYKRRAEEHPTYAGRKSGIVVLRGEKVIQKEGTCLYPNEQLIGGWCRVFKLIEGRMDETYKEVGFSEYDKKKANWVSKPCTMIEKVAVSQALRAAFPKDYEGLYTPEEVSPIGDIPPKAPEVEKDEPITQDERQALFDRAFEIFGERKKANAKVKELIEEIGCESTIGMLTSQYRVVMARLEEVAKDLAKQNGVIDVEYEDVDE